MHRRVCTTGFHVILFFLLEKNLTCPMRFFEDRRLKPPRVAKRDRPDDEDDMDALDESPDSSTLAQVKLATEFTPAQG